MSVSKNARNVVIVLVLAAAVALLPGGGAAANTIRQAIALLFLAALGWLGMIMYRQHHVDLYGLGERRRAMLYVAVGVAALTFTATSKLWNTGGGELAWFVLIGAAAYTVFAVVSSARKY